MKITLYSTGCPQCRVLKRKLDDLKLEYDIVSDPQQIIAMGFQSAPVLEIDGERYNFVQGINWVREYQ